jgi:monovalent cation/hydrogen antiporter
VSDACRTVAAHRGIVTVVAALALPQNFLERGRLLFAAFTVTLGRLLVQGLTLRPLVLALHLKDDDRINREARVISRRLMAQGGETGRWTIIMPIWAMCGCTM